MVDSRELLKHLLILRGPWTKFQSDLCKKIRRLLRLCTQEHEGDEEENERNARFQSNSNESAVARRLLTRLRALSHLSTQGEKERDVIPEGFIDKTSFSLICKGAGIVLTPQDITLLADATDFLPFCDNIRYNIIVEALSVEVKSTSSANKLALDHFTKLLWNTASKLHRSKSEWQVYTMFLLVLFVCVWFAVFPYIGGRPFGLHRRQLSVILCIILYRLEMMARHMGDFFSSFIIKCFCFTFNNILSRICMILG